MTKKKAEGKQFDSELFYESVRNRLISMRKARGLKREDLEVALGLTRSAAWRLEKKNQVTVPQIVELSKIYDFQPIDFLREAIDEATNDKSS